LNSLTVDVAFGGTLTSLDRVETMLNELIERFKRWGVDLERK